MRNKFALLLAIWALLSTSAIAEIQVLNPHVNPGSANGNAALHLKIINSSLKPDKLIKVTALEAPQMKNLSHVVVEDNNQTETPTFVVIPQEGNVDLQSSERHLVLTDLNKDLKVGDEVNLSLTFQNQGTINVKALVKDQ